MLQTPRIDTCVMVHDTFMNLLAQIPV